MDIFNNSYTDYWKDRVDKLSDGTKIADSDIVNIFLPMLGIQKTDKVVDMGCSFGRFYNLLSQYSNHITGIDIEPSAIQRASEFGYERLEVGSLEKMPFDDASFDKAFCWAVLDCTKQEDVFSEANRILKTDGVFLVTGKNDHYHQNDDVAFIAERNARFKSFPNHFTNVKVLISELDTFGFSLLAGFIFERRGDFGEAKMIPLNEETINIPYYEYLLILKKQKDCSKNYPVICDIFSQTAIHKAQSEKIEDMDAFFKYHSENDKNN